MLRFKFSLKITLICTLLALGMLRLAYWQWNRHLEKKEYIQVLTERLNQSVLDFDSFKKISNFDELIHRRVEVKGEYDFDNEIILNNRRKDGMPGVFVITPFSLKNSQNFILINRGFIPFSEKDKRAKFRKPLNEVTLVALVKESKSEKFLAPKDPKNSLEKPALSWARINVKNIAKQLPYKLLPIFLEVMPSRDLDKALKSVVSSSKGKDEILNLAMSGVPHAPDPNQDWTKYPIPSFSTVIPPGRHFGYVFEWSAMALLTILIALVLQLKRNK